MANSQFQLNIKTPAYVEMMNNHLISVNLYDEIVLEKINERKIQIIKTNGYKIPTNNENLVYKIALALQNHKPNKFGVKINISKNIPTFSGLNSQASNAVGVLLSLNKLWNFNFNQKELIKIAKNVDIKIAEILKLKLGVKCQNIVLIRPKYIKIDENWIKKIAKTRTFESIAFKYFPDIKKIASLLKKSGCEKVGMSGKGPILFGFFKNMIDAQKIQNGLNEKIDFIWTGVTC